MIVFVMRFCQRREFIGGCTPFGVCPFILGTHTVEGWPPKPVEHLALSGTGSKPLLIGLAVHDNKVVPDFGEHAKGNCATTRNRTAATLCHERTPEDQFVILELTAAFLHPPSNPLRTTTPNKPPRPPPGLRPRGVTAGRRGPRQNAPPLHPPRPARPPPAHPRHPPAPRVTVQ